MSDDELREQVQGCDAVASCLGHNLTFKGIFGHPRRLVADATRRLCQAIKISRINVTHFMADLITEQAVWEQWQGQMPIIYNKES